MNYQAEAERVWDAARDAVGAATRRDPLIRSASAREHGYAVLAAALRAAYREGVEAMLRWIQKNWNTMQSLDEPEEAARLLVLEEQDAMDSVRRGLDQSGTIDRGSFAQYIDRSADGDVDVPPPAGLREEE